MRAINDESWQQWVEEYDAGEALILRLDVTARIDDGDESVRVSNRGVWVEKDVHPPAVAGQVQQAVTKDFNTLAEKLRADAGVAVTADDLADMYVDVELADDLLRALATDPVAPRRLEPQVSGDQPL